MANVFGERLPVLRRVLDHPWVKIALAVWAIIAAYDTFSSQILPEWLAAKAPKVREVVAMTSGWLPYWAWLLILAALLVVASFEYAFRRTDLGFIDASGENLTEESERGFPGLALGASLGDAQGCRC